MPTEPEPSPRAPHEALTLPIDEIRWRGDEPRPKSKKRIAAAAAGAFVLGVANLADAAPDAPRLAQPGCIFHTVVRGDTVWRIAGKAGITLDVAARLNPQVPDLSKIEVGDQIATSCGTNEVQRTQLAPAVHVVNVAKWYDEREADGRMTYRAIIAYGYTAGFRGEDLVTLAAIVPGESSRGLLNDGDIHLQDNVWGPSIPPLMVRSVKAQKGTGRQRDEDLLRTLPGNFKSAFELYEAAKDKQAKGWIYPKVTMTMMDRGKPYTEVIPAHVWRPFDDWSAFLNRSHLAVENGVVRMDLARQAAREVGVA